MIDVSEIEEILKRELESVSEWLAENRLSLHLSKTESILFGSNKRLAKCKELNITCNGIDIGSGSEVTYLGVTLDQNLSGSSMITKIISKCNKKIKFLYRNANNLDKQTKILRSLSVIHVFILLNKVKSNQIKYYTFRSGVRKRVVYS